MKNDSVDKSKTLIRFGFYMLFILMVVAMIIASGVRPEINTTYNVNNNVIVKKTYIEKEEELINGIYNYKFVVDDGIIVFEGLSTSGERKGIKRAYDKTIEYIKKDKVYIKENGKEILYENLYDELDENLFNFKSLFDILNEENCLIDRRDEETIYSYADIMEYDFNIITNEEHIIRTEIKGEKNYIFNFTY